MKEKIITSLFTLILIVIVQQEEQIKPSKNSSPEEMKLNANTSFKETQNDHINSQQKEIAIVKYYENFYDFIKENS